MAGSFEDRRTGADRRRAARGAAPAGERRGGERRQFAAPADPAALSAAARRVASAIDAYKAQRGLARISVDELVGILKSLGYREA